MSMLRVPVEVQAVRDDGCVTLELNETLDYLRTHNVHLSEGMSILIWEQGADEVYETVGTAHFHHDWGWGERVDPTVLATFQP